MKIIEELNRGQRSIRLPALGSKIRSSSGGGRLTQRFLTKSRFKLGLECPTKLFYTGKPDIYPNQKLDDPFLLALAKGGFQVGELAKCYFPGGIEVAAMRGDYEGAIRETTNLLAAENATVFEAAVAFDSFFIRIDILVKNGNRLDVIEVKSKSYKEGESEFFGKRGGISADWKTYLYDVAFQKYVVQCAFPDHSVSAFLMLVDKGSKCPTDGLNQKFRVKTTADGVKYCELTSDLMPEEVDPTAWMLRRVNVDKECDLIFSGHDTTPPRAMSLAEMAAKFADFYSRDERIPSPITGHCKKCEFRANADEEAAGLKSGFKECWSSHLGWSDPDFLEPNVLDIWNYHHVRREKLIQQKRIKLTEFTEEDLTMKASDRGLSSSQRQWMQVSKAVARDTSHFIDVDGLRFEMDAWKFPLHFIDFETATPGIPFTKGRSPYEEVAFQYSHHVVHDDGRVEHAGEYLDDRIAYFPNYDFVRKLRDELVNDDGTIFRYADHENKYLVRIYCQLIEDPAEIADRGELCEFIKSITVGSANLFGAEAWEGERKMVDMWDLVKRYYYDPYTKGSNSIKDVLPAMLNSSAYLQAKYSGTAYGTEINSLNFKNGQAWVNIANGAVKNPYLMLPPVFGSDLVNRLSDDNELKDGGAAMIAYARLQFEDMSPEERSAIIAALKRYCELDTLAMVMIYEGWREMVSAART